MKVAGTQGRNKSGLLEANRNAGSRSKESALSRTMGLCGQCRERQGLGPGIWG